MPTIRDIAKTCGVSITAVSQAINGKGRMSGDTRDRVLDTIKRMGYDPAGHLPTARLAATRTIGLVLPLTQITTADSFYYRAILAATAAAAERGSTCKLFTENDLKTATTVSYHRGRAQLGCDSIITYCPCGTWEPVLTTLRSWDIPAVVIRRSSRKPGTVCLTNDDYAGAALAMDHLASAGHKTVAICIHSSGTASEKLRLQSYRDRIAKHGLNDDPRLVVDMQNSYKTAERHLRTLLDTGLAPTAVFCTGDTLASRVIRDLAKMGLRVPEDISVIGYDDDPVAAEYNPPITTVRIPVEEMIRAAVDLLVRRDIPAEGARETVFKNELIVRDSTLNTRNADGAGRKA